MSQLTVAHAWGIYAYTNVLQMTEMQFTHFAILILELCYFLLFLWLLLLELHLSSLWQQRQQQQDITFGLLEWV